MADITITHTPETGTILSGSAKGDGVWEIARQHGFTYRRSVGIFIMGSRDRKPQTWKINAAKTALEAAGHTVELDLDDRLRSVAERETAQAERLEDRQEALEAKAARLGEQGTADYERARQMADAIPFGQPMMPDHYSYRHDVNYRKRMQRTYDRAFETLGEAKETDRKAEASRTNQRYRETGPVTERRIAKLEAERRKVERDMAPCPVSGKKVKPEGQGKTTECRLCWNPITLGETVPEHGRRISQAHGEQRLAELDDELGYWRTHLQELIDSGRYRKWGPGDFQVGDYVLTRFGCWSKVEKVNRKTLSVPSGYGWLDKIPFDEALGRRSKAEQEGKEESA